MSRKKAEQKPAAMVYCGPTVRGVAKRYTVYHNGLPETLKKLTVQFPEAGELTVPLDRFAATRKALQQVDSTQSLLYARLSMKLHKEMNKEE